MPDDPVPEPLFAEPAGGGKIDDDDLLAILESAIDDERAAQQKYRRGLDRCADPEACRVFERLLREEEAHEHVLAQQYAEVKKRIGLGGAGRGA